MKLLIIVCVVRIIPTVPVKSADRHLLKKICRSSCVEGYLTCFTACYSTKTCIACITIKMNCLKKCRKLAKQTRRQKIKKNRNYARKSQKS